MTKEEAEQIIHVARIAEEGMQKDAPICKALTIAEISLRQPDVVKCMECKWIDHSLFRGDLIFTCENKQGLFKQVEPEEYCSRGEKYEGRETNPD